MNNISKIKNLNRFINIFKQQEQNLFKSINKISFCNNNNNSTIKRCYSNSTQQTVKPLAIGQPTFESHPHLLKKDEISKGIFKEEFKERRRRLLERFQVGSLIVLFTGPEPMMSNDIPWSFRQDTNFNYFTGFYEPEAVLVLEKTSDIDHISHLFVRERIPEKEKWDGPRCGGENVKKYFGIENGYNLYKDLPILDRLLKSNGANGIHCNQAPWEELVSKLPSLQSSSIKLYSIKQILESIRLVKSKSEISTMLKSGEIAGESFSETMKYVGGNSRNKNELNEYQVSAYFEWCIKDKGAQRMSYPPVVAGGNNGHTLHYIANNQILNNGDLILMDAGCEYWGYTSDITRTFPINGKFSKEQSEIYNAVLDVNKKCIEMCKVGESINSIHLKSIELIESHLKELGILNNSNPNTYRLYYPHSIGHYLGMDTHDTIDFGYDVQLEEGMIITIEPGIYISKYDMNVPPQYRGISIRVEDDVVVAKHDKDPLVLTYKAPKEIDQIEKIMSS